ncbi:UNVERIFIED_CONTAM: 13S globulin seed storage protein 1 [Sesamum radiatum]|uniref:13S globulin seed storage protein 1 n=1 Tax=Sesamum radiatum TaxID=300843 RepID=A0AAW2MWY2_SESRA
MELDLSPQNADGTVYEGEEGGYYAWTAARSPAISQAKLGAGKLLLRPRSFALPHYADAFKIGYVAQGSLGALAGFSTEFTSKIYHLHGSDSKKLATSQTNALLVKIGEEIDMPRQSNCDTKDYVFDLDDLISSGVNGTSSGVNHAELTAKNFLSLDKIGLSASLVRLEPNSVLDPYYSTDGSHQIIYVTKGSGRIQIMGLNGTRVLDASVQEDQAFVVPKFFAIAQLAGEHGMEYFSVSTSPRPILGHLAGNESAWKALSSPVLQATLNVPPEFVKLFKSNMNL